MHCKRVFIFLAVMLFCLAQAVPVTASEKKLVASLSVDSLFDSMEKCADQINAISASVILQNSAASKSVTLSIKSPDKFAIVFADGSVKALFNGKNLWIYVVSINEVFYHFSETGGFFGSYYSWFNPKKLFTNLTRKTLFTFFRVEMLKAEELSDSETIYHLKFNPKMESVFRSVFDVGHYEMAFSSRTYLPSHVVEFDRNGHERGRLQVVEYKMNDDIADSFFDFVVPDGVAMVPVTVVLAQKLEEYADAVVEKLGRAAEELKNRIINWSF